MFRFLHCANCVFVFLQVRNSWILSRCFLQFHTFAFRITLECHKCIWKQARFHHEQFFELQCWRLYFPLEKWAYSLQGAPIFSCHTLSSLNKRCIVQLTSRYSCWFHTRISGISNLFQLRWHQNSLKINIYGELFPKRPFLLNSN